MSTDAVIAIVALGLTQIGALIVAAYWFGARLERITVAIEHLGEKRAEDLERIQRLEEHVGFGGGGKCEAA